jgi:hypothetical protein
MTPPRYLCSHLVTLCCNGREIGAILEEIWREGAVLECDEEPQTEGHIEMQCGPAFFGGTLKAPEKHAFGWRVEMAFSPETPWSEQIFRPDHMLDPESLQPRPKTG